MRKTLEQLKIYISVDLGGMSPCSSDLTLMALAYSATELLECCGYASTIAVIDLTVGK